LQQTRFNQIDWNLQKAKIEIESYKYNKPQITVDSTGVGNPIAEDLERAGLNIEPFVFTENSRRQLLDNLALLIEQDKIKLPNDEGLINELEAFRFELTKNGKVKVAVPDGIHDDRVMSLAMACWGVTGDNIIRFQSL